MMNLRLLSIVASAVVVEGGLRDKPGYKPAKPRKKRNLKRNAKCHCDSGKKFKVCCYKE